jgi:hypothetical protein
MAFPIVLAFALQGESNGSGNEDIFMDGLRAFRQARIYREDAFRR